MSGNGSSPASFRERLFKKSGWVGIWNRTLTILLMLVLVSLVCIFAFLRLYQQNTEDSVSRSLQHSVEQRKNNIDHRLGSLLQLDYNLIASIYPYTYSQAGTSDQYTEFAELTALLSNYASNDDISNIRLYLSGDKLYSHQGTNFNPLDDLIRTVGTTPTPYLYQPGIHWLETHSISFTGRSSAVRRSYDVITLSHAMRDRYDYDKLACVLMLDVEVSKFNEMLSSNDNFECVGYLANADGRCLASPNTDLLHETVLSPDVLDTMAHTADGYVTDSGRLYVYSRLDYNDWYVVMDYPENILSAANSPQGNALQILIVVVMVIALTLIAILAYNYMVNVTLTRINASLNAMNTGKVPTPEKSRNFLYPLHQLEDNADRMVMTVKDLMESQYKDQLAIAQSEMKSLQAQIKPHFLYNTLDVIKWMILDRRNDEATQMVTTLSKYLRHSINKGPGIIPLREELELSKTYISLMLIRFNNCFTVNFEVEAAAEASMIPKLSLQPLLENALLHGILYCEKPEKELSVRAWIAEQDVYIEVEDNGNGMDEDTRQQLENGTIGYGLSNVRKRLELFTGGAGQFDIFSRQGFGTCIAIRLPFVAEENKDT